MVFLKISEKVATALGVKELYSHHSTDIRGIMQNKNGILSISAMCDSLFYFENGVTRYLKNRMNDQYQYTPEEELMIRLTATPL
jgi:hypothetical protein